MNTRDSLLPSGRSEHASGRLLSSPAGRDHSRKRPRTTPSFLHYKTTGDFDAHGDYSSYRASYRSTKRGTVLRVGDVDWGSSPLSKRKAGTLWKASEQRLSERNALQTEWASARSVASSASASFHDGFSGVSLRPIKVTYLVVEGWGGVEASNYSCFSPW